MKRVFIVRHAKSDWDNNLEDFDRPLNNRGHKDAPQMAQKLLKKGYKPDMLISSSAMRAITTAKYFASEFGYPDNCILEKREIYDIGYKFVLDMIKELPENTKSVMIFGHNPDQSHLATYLSNEQIGNMPTCAVVGIEFDTDDWSAIIKSDTEFLCYETPKGSKKV